MFAQAGHDWENSGKESSQIYLSSNHLISFNLDDIFFVYFKIRRDER